MKTKVLSIVFVALAASMAIGSLLAMRVLNASEHSSLKEPIKSVYDRYIDIQRELAQDSLIGLNGNAQALIAAAQQDGNWDPTLVHQATILAHAKDLSSARAALKSVSNVLINYLDQNQMTPGTYYQAYCSMAKASWLQTGKTVNNPYMGQAMAECGQIMPNFKPQSAAEAVMPATGNPHGNSPPVRPSNRGHSCCPH